MPHVEHHRIHRAGWLRAAVLGANDGIISTASLIMGLAAAEVSIDTIVLTGSAGLVAGAMSMAIGEFVSVKAQEDIELADLRIELEAIENDHEGELGELADIYCKRGLEPELAKEVARQLMVHDALGAHARDDIGITGELSARPLQAAISSACMFAAGAAIPVLLALVAPLGALLWMVPSVAVLILGILGAGAAATGGASPLGGALRVCVLGSFAMIATALIGKLFTVTL